MQLRYSVCGMIHITEEFHVVPCCLHRLLSSPVEAVITYCQPSGHSDHMQVERSFLSYSFPLCAVGWGERTGELQKLQTVLKVCVTLMSNLSTSVCYRELGGEKKRKEKNVDYMAEIPTAHTHTHLHTHQQHTVAFATENQMIFQKAFVTLSFYFKSSM